MALEDIVPLFCLMANHVKAGNTEHLKIDLDNLFRHYTIDYIKDILQQILQDKLQIPISGETLAPLIAENLKNLSNNLWQ
jgi:hypothetical protein